MKTLPTIHWKAFSISKLGNSLQENEDSFLPGLNQHTFMGEQEFACALADGATRTSFSSIWARLLVEEAQSRAFPSNEWSELVSAAQARWASELANIDLPWHAEEKVKQGSFATFLWFGLKFASRQGGAWRAVAVGDSCLFQIRGGVPITRFPVQSPSDFYKDPVLLSSYPARNLGILSHPKDYLAEGDWAPGDEFFLMTDALAAWFLSEFEGGNTPLGSLRDHFLDPASTQDSFNRWVCSLRQSGAIKNDDTTVIWICPEVKLTDPFTYR
jgi:hypothetical protein